jgi:hypothetical protein
MATDNDETIRTDLRGLGADATDATTASPPPEPVSPRTPTASLQGEIRRLSERLQSATAMREASRLSTPAASDVGAHAPEGDSPASSPSRGGTDEESTPPRGGADDDATARLVADMNELKDKFRFNEDAMRIQSDENAFLRDQVVRLETKLDRSQVEVMRLGEKADEGTWNKMSGKDNDGTWNESKYGKSKAAFGFGLSMEQGGSDDPPPSAPSGDGGYNLNIDGGNSPVCGNFIY